MDFSLPPTNEEKILPTHNFHLDEWKINLPTWISTNDFRVLHNYSVLISSPKIICNAPPGTNLIHCGGVVLDSPGHFEK